jgi:nucleotide-binding universal stress UspA family protein
MASAKNPNFSPGMQGKGETKRKSSWGGFTRIVAIAIDPSANSRFAFEWYLNNVWRKDDMIVLVHCPESPTLPIFSFKSGIGVPAEEWTKLLTNMNAKTKKLEEDYEAECMKRKLKYKMRGESFKNVGEGICKISEDENADLIVMGTRGVGGSSRTEMGGVSEFVVRSATIPVIVVRAKKMMS